MSRGKRFMAEQIMNKLREAHHECAKSKCTSWSLTLQHRVHRKAGMRSPKPNVTVRFAQAEPTTN